jgi:HAD superfamily phosphatase
MNILIFDMDGVLIDVSKSYRKTIQRTVRTYVETCLGFERTVRELATNEEISLFKSAGGFNNDWDLTSGLLLYLLSVLHIPPLQRRKTFSSIRETVDDLKLRSTVIHPKATIPIKEKHFHSFLEKIRKEGGGLRGVHRLLGNSWEGWVYRSGDLDRENLIKRIFQEIYLGEKFTAHYHLPRLFYKGKGLYVQEKILISKKILASLRKKIQMGIASGRPKFEAELALKRFGLHPYFKSVVTLDECEEEENRIFLSIGKRTKCSKPNPYSILKTIQEIGISNPQCGFVGDAVDDIQAATAVKKDLPMLAIGFIGGYRNKKAAREMLLRAGADLVIQNPGELLHLVFAQGGARG